jgi:hypothetical protein
MSIGLVLQITGAIILVIGLTFSFFQRRPTIFSYIKNVSGIFSDFKGDNYFEKTRVEIKALEINTPNPSPEIGHDSEYELNIITPHPISKFFLKVRIPDSVWRPEEPFYLYKETVTGDSDGYDFQIKGGYAIFEILNAAGKYHLTFGNTKPEQLTKQDIDW